MIREIVFLHYSFASPLMQSFLNMENLSFLMELNSENGILSSMMFNFLKIFRYFSHHTEKNPKFLAQPLALGLIWPLSVS